MDKKKGLINVIVSISFKVILLVASILVRRYLIKYLGNDVNGLNSLYTSIIGFLSVAELGVGGAITFSMYKPIVEGDNDKVSALYHLFTKVYLIIGGIIFVVGCAITPLLPYLASDYQNIDQNIYITFLLYLVSVVISYLFSSKTSLINAYKNNYITTAITSSAHLLQYGVQILVLALTKSFVIYFVCAIGSIVLQWVITEIIARKKHGEIIKNRQKIDTETKKEVGKNVKAMFMHRIGDVLVNTADSVIISAFIGVAILGKYSNYTTIMTAMTSVLALCFTPLTSVIGHMCVAGDDEQMQKYFNFFHTFNFFLGIIFFLGYYAVIDNFVTILFASETEPNIELVKVISFVITINYFIQFMRQSVLLFRDATGTFYNDRWKPLIEGLCNVVLSILFVKIFPEEYSVVGVIVATIITNIFICHIVEPYVLFKHALHKSVKKFYLQNYLLIIFFVLMLVALHFCLQTYENQWIEMLVNGCISIALSLAACLVMFAINKDFRQRLVGRFKRIIKKP